IRQEDYRRKKSQAAPMSMAEKQEVVASVLNASTRACERNLAERSPDPVLPKRRKPKAIKGGRTQITLVFDQETMEMLDGLKEEMSHKQLGGDYAALIKEMAKMLTKQMQPKPPR